MDFVSGLPLTPKKNDAISVIIDRFTKSTHFLHIRMDFDYKRLDDFYIKEVIRLHGVPKSIISDHDPRFASRFGKSLQNALGTQVKLSSAFHPQTDGQFEQVIQILEHMLRSYVIEFAGSREKSIPLVEFAYNNTYQASIRMEPYEALHGKKCRTPLCWLKLGENKSLGPEVLREAKERQAFLKVSSRKKVFRFGRKGKLSPRFIGPFQITEKVGPVAYRLALPPEFNKIRGVFYVSMLRMYRLDPLHVLGPKEVELYPNLSYKEDLIHILAWEVNKLKNKSIPLVKVLWRSHKMEEATWEPEETMREQYPQPFNSSKKSRMNFS
ncbi:hypothetical protein GQ457_01G022410 [Hibiscus cannabinus]